MVRTKSRWRPWAITFLVGVFQTLSACTQHVEIANVHAEISSKENLKKRMLISFSASEDLRRLSRGRDIALVGVLHICGHDQAHDQIRYATIEYLENATDVQRYPYAYEFDYPSTLDRQVATFENPNDAKMSGWPEELVEQKGVCFRIEGAAMFGTRIVSNTVVTSEALQLLLK